MCVEAGGCHASVGNFRGVCPLNGRKFKQTHAMAIRYFASVYFSKSRKIAQMPCAGFRF